MRHADSLKRKCDALAEVLQYMANPGHWVENDGRYKLLTPPGPRMRGSDFIKQEEFIEPWYLAGQDLPSYWKSKDMFEKFKEKFYEE